MSKPKIITISGSSRFCDLIAVCGWLLERDEGAIALGLHFLPRWYTDTPDHLAEEQQVAQHMDNIHLKKIEMSDELFVVNFQGYIGESTNNEIKYAQAQGKPIRYFESDPIGMVVKALNPLKKPEQSTTLIGDQS